MNLEQADRVMAELGLDALVLARGVNFQHALGARPVITRMGRAPSAFAIVTRREKGRLAVVGAAFSYYFTLAERLDDLGAPTFLYTWPVEDDEGDTTAAAPPVFHDRGETPVDSVETRRVDATRSAIRAQGLHARLSDALAKALKDLGLAQGRLASDHPLVDATVETAAPKATVVDAEDALRRIRPVKSEVEIALMRQAAAGNVDAALEALKTVRAGGTHRDLRAEFFAAAARRGHRGVFMVVDRICDDLVDEKLTDGQALMIDCVSEYAGYHGDYGRTVFIGEPNRAMTAATRAMGDAWDKLREQLRPGLTFSEVSKLGLDAMKASGRTYRVPFGPHSVGLYHSDHAAWSGLLPEIDVVLQPGMVLSVDCPLLETGVGGSAHLEDLMLITADGAEPLHPTDQQTITV
ncbi:MAG: M24 family metallopeptidase [Pseudomonadota bacterium]